AQESICHIKSAILLLKAFIREYSFKDEAEEIHFFKKIKPEIVSKLIYHMKLFEIESRRPVMGSYEMQKDYLRGHLEKLTFFFKNHWEFYQYYRMGSTFLDEKYFIRGIENFHLCQYSLTFYMDPDFSTGHDYMVAQILVNDRLELFLKKEIETLTIKESNPNCSPLGITNLPFQWTESKISLVELIYAIHASGAINNGHCEIRELSAFFEHAFNVRIPDIYRTFSEIKYRSAPTKFIDSLRTSLLRKIEEDF
ncbi:MAG: RteC domain-containing protein, partial [Bacteroidota bacterium]|nr:RteC domain-containing protein [Bacteroidota bacterium]